MGNIDKHPLGIFEYKNNKGEIDLGHFWGFMSREKFHEYRKKYLANQKELKQCQE